MKPALRSARFTLQAGPGLQHCGHQAAEHGGPDRGTPRCMWAGGQAGWLRGGLLPCRQHGWRTAGPPPCTHPLPVAHLPPPTCRSSRAQTTTRTIAACLRTAAARASYGWRTSERRRSATSTPSCLRTRSQRWVAFAVVAGCCCAAAGAELALLARQLGLFGWLSTVLLSNVMAPPAC